MNFGNLFSQNANDAVIEDSSTVQLKKEFLENIKGIWILKASGSNWGMNETSKSEADEILMIDEKEIACYNRVKKSGKMQLRWSDNVIFFNKIYSPKSNSLLVSNYWIWTFTYSKENDCLHFVDAGQLMGDGMVNFLSCGNLEKSYQRFK
jgi:hypothetical protein